MLKLIILIILFLEINSCYINSGYKINKRLKFDFDLDIKKQLIDSLGSPTHRVKLTGDDSCFIYQDRSQFDSYCFNNENKLLSSGGGAGKYKYVEYSDEYFSCTEKGNGRFHSYFLKGFNEPIEITQDSVIRVLKIPSFEREELYKLLKDGEWKLLIMRPDSSIWNDIWIRYYDEKGNPGGGRIKKLENYLPSVSIDTVIVEEGINNFLINAKAANYLNLKSIRHKGLMMRDGIGYELEIKFGNESNYICWSKSNYDDKKYEEIETIIKDFTKSND